MTNSTTTARFLVFTFVVAMRADALTVPTSAFDQVIDVPPEIAPTSIGSNTQLNLFDGGLLPQNFQVGDSSGTSSNVELNIFGGQVGTSVDAYSGSSVNMFAGNLGGGFFGREGSRTAIHGGVTSTIDSAGSMFITGGEIGRFNFSGGDVTITNGEFAGSSQLGLGTHANISGGTFGKDSSFYKTSRVSLSGGYFESVSFYDTSLEFSGGHLGNGIVIIDGESVSPGSADFIKTNATISGGTFGGAFRALGGSHIHLIGQDFLLNGLPINGLADRGDSVILSARGGQQLSGVLADGNLIEIGLFEDFVNVRDGISADTTLQLTIIPEPTTLYLATAGLLAVVAWRRFGC